VNYIERMLKDGNVRPARGTIWAMAYTEAEFERIDGIGTIKLGATLDSGLVLPSLSDDVSDSYKSVMYVVLAIGPEEPGQWSWEAAGVRPYVMVASRAAAGMNQGDRKWMNLKWNEIMAIGEPKDQWPPMRPAPGYILIQEEEKMNDRESGVVASNVDMAYHYENPGIVWGEVLSLPKDTGFAETFLDGLKVGDRVAAPYTRASGGTEWLTAEDRMRVLPINEVLMVDDVTGTERGRGGGPSVPGPQS